MTYEPSKEAIEAAAKVFGTRIRLRDWTIIFETERNEYRKIASVMLIAAHEADDGWQPIETALAKARGEQA